jgi:hypothetical protein
MKLSWAVAPIAAAGFCVLQTGCSSIRTKIYDYDNYSCEGRQKKCLQGIPETVEVPTHIKITVMETRYFKGPAVKTDGSNEKAAAISATDRVLAVNSGNVDALRQRILELEMSLLEERAKATMNAERVKTLEGQIPKLQEDVKKLTALLAEQEKYALASLVCPTRSLTYEVIKRKELYTVDFKRPASGLGLLAVEYGPASDGQFFKSYGQQVDDTTIKDIGNLVGQVASVLPKLKAIADTPKDEAARLGLHAVTTVVAVEYFDVRQPNLEARIQEFLDRNINACSPPCGNSFRPPLEAPFPPQNQPCQVPVVAVPIRTGTAPLPPAGPLPAAPGYNSAVGR